MLSMETNQKQKRRMRMNKQEQPTIDTKAKEAMQKALEAYKKDTNSAKEFYPSSQEISLWLQTKKCS